MLVQFFNQLRTAGVPASLTEFLTLLEALKARIAFLSAHEFYYLARLCLVKDERHFDRFDRVFAEVFEGAEKRFEKLLLELPADWLKASLERQLTDAERRRVESVGGWEQLLEALRARLREQSARHEGGSKWIGTGGTSPFGAGGYNPEGIRIGQAGARQGRALKVWERREYRNFDDRVELGTRNLKLALRKLRRLAREGAAEELDLHATIDATARNAGLLDLKLVPERHNTIKLLLFLDVGGSMDEHVRVCEELFSAARGEFKHLEYFYFHNFIYENVWRDNRRRHTQMTPMIDVLHRYGRDYRVILVGDATMSPYEITQPGGSIEHWNPESGAVWIERLCAAYPRLVWLNPQPQRYWDNFASIVLVRELIGERMHPLTLAGLDGAMAQLRRPLTTQRAGSTALTRAGEAPREPPLSPRPAAP